MGCSQEVSQHSAEDQYWQSLDATRLPTAQQSKDRETCGSVATQWSWRSCREQRSRRGRVSHSDVGDSSVSRGGRVFRKKDRPFVQSTSGLTSFSRKDNGEFGTSRKLVGTSVRLVGGEWKFHYVHRTRDVAGRNRKHQDQVKRKRNTMIEEESIMRSA